MEFIVPNARVRTYRKLLNMGINYYTVIKTIIKPYSLVINCYIYIWLYGTTGTRLLPTYY